MKKIISLALALVLALSLGVTAFAGNYYDGLAGGYYHKDEETHYMDWTWDVFEKNKDSYCRIAVDFRYDKDVDIYVSPDHVLNTYLNTNGKEYWDWSKSSRDSFELFAEGPFTYTVKNVTLEDANNGTVSQEPYQVIYDGAFFDVYVDAAENRYIYAKLGDHNDKMYYMFSRDDIQGVEKYAIKDNAGNVVDYEVWEFKNVDLELTNGTDGKNIEGLKLNTFGSTSYDEQFYRIRITPVDDYGTKVVRGSIYFKLIDYTSGTTSKFTASPLYIDFYHVDVLDNDVKDIAGEKKAMVLDMGEPYDNEFKCGKHDHEGGYTVDMPMFVDGLYDYDAVYGKGDQTPDVVSKEHFDEGVGKTLKITNLSATWRLEMAKVAEYQPSVNFTSNVTVADVVKAAFPNAKFQAVNFLTPADGVIYKTASKLYIKCDAKALGQKGEATVYAYKYTKDGVLEYQDAFQVNYYNNDSQYVYVELAAGESLGSYYLSDTDLRGSSQPSTEPEKNPNTGANDVVGVAVALAVVSLVAAAAVSLKK